MDEPSAVLDPGEVDNLFRVIRDLTAQGVAVVYISHRLEEIREIGDRVTVLKDGRTVATGLVAADTPDAGPHPADDRPVHRVRLPRASGRRRGEPVLEVEGLSGTASSRRSISVAPGEIVGLAGLVGSGRSEILETVYGARRAGSGSVTSTADAAQRLGARGGERRCRPGAGGAQEPRAAARPVGRPQRQPVVAVPLLRLGFVQRRE